MPRARLPQDWPSLPDDALLDVRMCDLPLAIEGSLAERIAQLRDEMAAKGLRCPIHFYLADEWFTPDGATAIAIPFYLAHPRLEKLEESQMFEVEGGEHEWCMRILRHEAGHAHRQRLPAAAAAAAARGVRLTRPSRIRSSTRRSRTARATSCTSTRGTRRAIPTRTSPRRSRCGCRRRASGGSGTPAGRRCASSNTWTA